MSHIGLSKSKYAAYCQCPKLLWLSQYRTDEATPDPQAESRMEIGIQVGELARNYFEGTVNATELYPDGSQNRTAMLKRTQQLIDAATPVIAEAAFSYDGNYCAVDLLRNTSDGWVIYEVKSTTADSSEDEAEDKKNELIHTLDIAYQRWVLEQCGIKVSGTHLLALDKNYRLADTIDLHGLFADLDYADKVAEYYPMVANGVADAKRILQGTEPRIIAPTDNCTKKCAFWAYCTKHMPAKNPFSIMGMQFRTARKYYEQGYETFETLRTAPKLNPSYLKVIEAELDDIDFIELPAIREFLDTVKYPLYHLDFETMQPAIPQFKGTKPYQQIPFQYSLHIQYEPCGPVDHKEFLAVSGQNPLRDIAEALVRDIPFGACSIAYNKGFEQTRLKELAELFPDLADHLLSIRGNMVDLDVPFRKKNYYTKAMQGSYSIKYVLPALFPDDPELDYHSLEDVHNGGEAMTIFPKIQFMEPKEQARVRANLLKYCCLDTYAMVKVLGKLYMSCGLPKSQSTSCK